MKDTDAVRMIARGYRTRMDAERLAFLAVLRMDFTDRFRELTGRDSTRIKVDIAAMLEEALAVEGLGVFRHIADTPTNGYVRIFRMGTPLFRVLDLFQHPSPEGDRILAGIVNRIKGRVPVVAQGQHDLERAS